jgi:hypothetical protein
VRTRQDIEPGRTAASGRGETRVRERASGRKARVGHLDRVEVGVEVGPPVAGVLGKL